MRTLYVSDLDGTLLDKSAALDCASFAGLKELLCRGTAFTAATARSPYSCRHILNGLPLRLPLILMNGALMYDLESNMITSFEHICGSALKEALRVFSDCGANPFLYAVKDGELSAYYKLLDGRQQCEFYRVRCEKYNKRFCKVDSFAEVSDVQAVYLTSLYEKSRLDGVYELVKEIEGLSCAYYRDVYSDGLWYLEVFSDKATKQNGVEKIKSGFDRVVGFGDSENDLSLFEACDMCVAVENACDALKRKADVIIGEGEVIQYIKDMEEIKYY